MDPNGSLDRTSHAIFDLFCRLGICDEESVQPYYPKVRDRDDISVYRCNRSGVLLLSRSDDLSASHYVKKTGYRYIAPQLDRATAVRFGIEDAERRSNQIKALVSGKRWLDVGTGSGGLLDLLRHFVSQVEAVEPQEIARRALISDGYAVHDHLRHTASNQFDVVTLFHVLEHLDDPIAELEHVRRCLRDGGKVIIEVPHAEDFLLSFLGLEEFKAFTFWSEHLVLYTRLALRS
ncbi:MAG: class I SAM-dependent methyltransferase, partial [Haliea sp.]